MKQVGNTILAKGGNHILAKRDNSAWPKGSKLSGFSSRIQKGSQMEQILKWNMGAQNTGEKEKDGMHKVIRELTP